MVIERMVIAGVVAWFAVASAAYGATATNPWPANFATVDTHTTTMKSFLSRKSKASSGYGAGGMFFGYTTTGNDERCALGEDYKVNGIVKLSWKGTSGESIVTVTRLSDGDVRTFTTTGTSVEFLAPEIGRNYKWTVRNGGAVSGPWYFYTDGEAPRIIPQSLAVVGNCRDLGGWVTADGKWRVRQGLGYRNDHNADFVTYEQLKPFWTDIAKIKTDMDLRDSLGSTKWYCNYELDENGNHLGRSPYGANWWNVKYWNVVRENDYGGMMYAYKSLVEKRTGLAKYSASTWKLFADARNLPIVVHCSQGRDRTGTVAFVLLGALGVGLNDLYADWALTDYAAPKDFPAKSSDEGGSTIVSLYNAIKAAYPDGTYPTLQDKCIKLMGDLGVSDAQIQNLKSYLLEPVEEKLTADPVGKTGVSVPKLSATSVAQTGKELRPTVTVDTAKATVDFGGGDYKSYGKYLVTVTLKYPSTTRWSDGTIGPKVLPYCLYHQGNVFSANVMSFIQGDVSEKIRIGEPRYLSEVTCSYTEEQLNTLEPGTYEATFTAKKCELATSNSRTCKFTVYPATEKPSSVYEYANLDKAYFKTDYVPAARTDKIELRMMDLDASEGGGLFQCAPYPATLALFKLSAGVLRFHQGTQNKQFDNFTWAQNKVFDLTINGKTATARDVATGTTASKSVTLDSVAATPGSAFIGTSIARSANRGVEGTPEYHEKHRVYHLKAWANGSSLIHEFVPCKTTGGYAMLYDKVTKRLYPFSHVCGSTGTVTLGGTATPVGGDDPEPPAVVMTDYYYSKTKGLSTYQTTSLWFKNADCTTRWNTYPNAFDAAVRFAPNAGVSNILVLDDALNAKAGAVFFDGSASLRYGTQTFENDASMPKAVWTVRGGEASAVCQKLVLTGTGEGYVDIHGGASATFTTATLSDNLSIRFNPSDCTDAGVRFEGWDGSGVSTFAALTGGSAATVQHIAVDNAVAKATSRSVVSGVAGKLAIDICLGDHNTSEGDAPLSFAGAFTVNPGSTLAVNASAKPAATYPLIRAATLTDDANLAASATVTGLAVGTTASVVKSGQQINLVITNGTSPEPQPEPEPEPTPSTRFDAAHTIVCYGDSLTWGASAAEITMDGRANYHDGRLAGVAAVPQGYPYWLSGMVTDCNVINQSRSGSQTCNITSWSGEQRVDVKRAFTLPAVGSVSVATNFVFNNGPWGEWGGWASTEGQTDRDVFDRWAGFVTPIFPLMEPYDAAKTRYSVTGTLAGRHVRLAGLHPTNITVTVFGEGAAQEIAPGTQFIPDAAEADLYKNAIRIICAGGNDASDKTIGERYDTYIRPLLQAFAAKGGKYLIVSPSVNMGTASGTAATAVEQRMAEDFGDNYLNLRQKVVTEGKATAEALGVPFTGKWDATDGTGLKGLNDTVHFSEKGYKVMAEFIRQKLVALGYVEGEVPPPEPPPPVVDPTAYGAADTKAATYTWKGGSGPWNFTTNWTPSASATYGIPNNKTYATADFPATLIEPFACTVSNNMTVKFALFDAPNMTLVLDHASLTCNDRLDTETWGAFNFGNTATGSPTVEFRGAKAALITTKNAVRANFGYLGDGDAAGVCTVRFVVPATGWEKTAPIRTGNDSKVIFRPNVRIEVNATALGVPNGGVTNRVLLASSTDGLFQNGTASVTCATGARGWVAVDGNDLVLSVVAGRGYPPWIGDSDEASKAKYDVWAEAFGVSDPSAARNDAYLLNCANTDAAIEEAKKAFKITGIAVGPDGKVTVDTSKADFNGKVEINGARSVDGSYDLPEGSSDARFFKAFLRP